MSGPPGSAAPLLDEDVSPLPADGRRVQLLALSGGGFRGLFTARLLERLEADGRAMRDRFELIAGTSIGSIIAGGLALGVPASTVREAMEREGPVVFPPRGAARRLWRQASSVFRAPYDTGTLERVIDGVLGERRDIGLRDIPAALLIPCVSHTRADVRVFRSAGLAGQDADDLSLKEAMLASGAAPTFFPPRTHGTETFVDGAIVANAPDALALGEATSRLHVPLERIHTLSLGTAASARERPPARYGRPGKLTWIARSLLEVTMAAQERLTIAQCTAIQGDRYLRLDRKPSAGQDRAIALDRADPRAIRTLLDLADACHEEVTGGADRERLRGFLRHACEGARR